MSEVLVCCLMKRAVTLIQGQYLRIIRYELSIVLIRVEAIPWILLSVAVRVIASIRHR